VLVLVLVAVLVVAVVLLALVAPSTRNDGPPLDPTSTGATGTRAAVELAGRLGADVEVTSELPGDDVDVAIAFEDIIDDDLTPRLMAWIAEGHTFVMADPASELAPVADLADSDLFTESVRVDRGACDAREPLGLTELDRLESYGPVFRYDVPVDAAACFGNADGAVVVVEAVGRGRLVSVGTPWVFTNEALDQADNAGLFAALAVPEEGTRLAVLTVGDGGDDLQPVEGDGPVLPTGVSLALLQLVVAFVVYALYRARRLGRPVPEDPPVLVAGSELTRAVGGLLEHAGARDRAGRSLRRAARRRLEAAYGLAAGTDPRAVAATTAARSGLDPERLERALVDGPVADDEALAGLGRELDALVEAALRPPTPSDDPTPPGGPA